MLHLLRKQLLASGVPAAAGMVIERRRIMSQDRRFAVSVNIQEFTTERVHAHIVSWLPNLTDPEETDSLDACVMGFGSTPDEQAAEVWLRLVGAPVLSCLSGQAVLDAAHFAGKEPWGIPGGHGFAGPFIVRGDAGAVDMEVLARSEAFRFDGYPRDGRRHLVKSTLFGQNSRWARHLEIDGHAEAHMDDDWRGMPAPRAPVICVRFAVFDMIG